MAISDSQKLDFLWKKLGYGFSKTETNSNKLAVNESISSPLLLRGDNIWTQSGSIPTVQPGSSSSLVTVYPTSTPLECTNDGSASPNRTWLTGVTDWISPEFGATFIIKVYIHTSGDAANAASSGTQVLAAGSGNNDEWFFDYQSGVLNFNGTNLPNGVNFSGKSVYIAGARYNGSIGIDNLEISNLNVSGISTFAGNVAIGTDSNLTANLTIGNIEETSTTNKGALAIKTLANSDSNIGESAIFIEESGSNYGFYHKASTYFSTTHYQLLESGSGNTLFTISDTGDIGIKTNYADTFALKILSEDENVIKIENTNNGLWGSDIRIVQDSNSPAANDKLFTLDVRGNSSAGTESIYSKVIASIEDPTDGSEDGKFTIQTSIAETLTDRIVIDSGGVGIGTTNAVNAALQVEGRNFAFGGPGDNTSGEGNVYIGNFNNPLLDSYDRNIRIGSPNEIQIELYTAYTATEYSDSVITSSTSGVGWQFNANNGNSSRSGAYPFYYSMGNAKTDDYIFWQAGDRYMWFDADTGRLGINRSTGNGWTDTLDVNGSAKVNGNLTVDAGTNSTITVKCDNTGAAGIQLYGDGQGTGFVEVGTYDGGGMSYNGDNSPAFVSGETADNITFYRMVNGNRSEVFSYPYNSDTVTFNGNVTSSSTITANSFSLPQNTVGTTYGNGVSSNPTYKIQQTVGDNDGWRIYGEAPASNDVKMIFEIIDDIETGDTWVFRNKKTYSPYNATEPFVIQGGGDVTASGNVTAYSDITLKKNIELIPNALDKVLSLRGITYNRIDIENEPKQSGVIAQEVEKVLPEVVHTNEEGIKSVAYGNMVGLLIEAIKEQQQQIDELRRKLEEK